MLDIRDSVKERSGTLHDQNDFSERGRKFIDGQFDFQVKTHQFEVKNLVKQLSQVLVYGTLHDYDKEDPILKLCIQTPHSHKNPDKNCYSCSKTGGDDITCNYCGYKSCKDCTQKKRPYPGQPIQQQQGKQKLLRGIICKVCERKFQLGVFHARETSIIVRNEEQINQLNQNLKAKQATLEGVKKECNDIKSQMMKIDNDQVNFQERIKIDIEKLEDLVVAQETTIQRTENKINDLIQQNEQSKIEKKNQEENIKQLIPTSRPQTHEIACILHCPTRGGSLLVSAYASTRERKQRPSSAKRRRSTGKKGNQMANKSYASSEIGGDESRYGVDPEGSKDFKAAYQQLVEKIYQEQGNTILISHDEIQKLEHSKHLSEEDFRQRISEFESKKQLKIQQKLDDVKDKDLEGCTFHPQLVTHHDSNKRNLDQFLEDQRRFQEKVHNKIHQVQEQSTQDVSSTMHPTIDETSKKICEEKLHDRKNKSTHERLYDLNKEKQEKLRQKQEDEREKIRLQSVEISHNVSVSASKREKPLDQTLYEDAERRKRDLQKLRDDTEKARSNPNQSKFFNENSDKYVVNRFEKEINQLEQEYAHEILGPQADDENTETILGLNFEKMVQALCDLGFLPSQNTTHTHDLQLCQDLWSLVKGQSRGHVTFDTLRVLCLNFIGVKTTSREGDAPAEEDQEQPNNDEEDGDQPADQPNDNQFAKLGFFHEDKFYLKRGLHSAIFTHFKNFYIHRMQFVGGVQKRENPKPKAQAYSNEQMFQAKPYISTKSAQLADNKRKKMLGDRAGANLVEILLIPKHNEAYLEEKRKQIYDKEVEGCTFAPKTIDFQTTAQRESHGDRCLDLYSSKPKGWFKEKETKTLSDYEFEKGKDDCLFRPKINDPSSLQALNDDQNIDQIRGVDKVMDRMVKARQTQMEKEMMTKRGTPAQIMASLGKPEPTMNFTSNKSKFKSAFGVDGSQIIPPKKSNRNQHNFDESQRMDRSQLSSARQQEQQRQQHQQQQQQQIRQPARQQQQLNVQQQPVRQQPKTKPEVQPQQQMKQVQQQQQQEQVVQRQVVQQQQIIQQQQQIDADTFNITTQQQQHQDNYYEEEQEQQHHEELREGVDETDYDNNTQSYPNDDSNQQSPVKSQNDREPMLYVDVNLGTSGTQRIVVFEGDTAEGLALKFAIEYSLDESMKEKLTQMLQNQIASVLQKIDEEIVSNGSNQNDDN